MAAVWYSGEMCLSRNPLAGWGRPTPARADRACQVSRRRARGSISGCADRAAKPPPPL